MELDSLHEASNQKLLTLLPSDQLDRVFNSNLCDIDPSFLGFVGIYDRLADIIPEAWTVVDLGCAYAPQSAFFDKHKAYIGVDVLTPVDARFAGRNVRHYEMSIAAFIEQHARDYRQEMTFAVCSYVPPWHGDNMALARSAFKNVFTYYPAGSKLPVVNFRPHPG